MGSKKSNDAIPKTKKPINKNKFSQINIKNFICPLSIEQKDLNFFTILSKTPRFVRTFFVSTVPRFLKFGESIRALYHFGNNNTSVFICPIKESVGQSNLNEIISQFDEERIKAEKAGDHQKVNVSKQKKLEAEFLRDEVATNSNRLFEITILSTLFADSVQELESYSDLLGFEASKEAVNIRSAWSQQDLAFSSNLPYYNNKIVRNNVFDMYAAATLIPFISTDISHQNGIPYGINNKSNIPIFIDAFSPDFINYNCIVYGNAKSSKSLALQLISLRSYALAGIPSVAVDSNGSFLTLSYALDGTIVKIGGRSNSILNPFEIEYEVIRDEITGREISILNLDKKIDDVTDVLMTMARGTINSQYVNKVTREIIREAVMEEYKDLGITTHPDSIYSSQGANLVGTKIIRNKKALPTIGSWYKRICAKASGSQNLDKKYHYEYLIKYMSDYVKEQNGKYSYYDGQSNVEIDYETAFSSINLSSLTTAFEKTLAQHVVLAWLWEKYFKTNSEDRTKAVKRRLILDDAWMCIHYSESSKCLENIFNRAALKNISFTAVSDRFRDFFAKDEFMKVLREASLKLLLKQDESEIEYFSDAFNLNRGEASFLRNCYKNEGIIQIGTNRAQIYFVVSEHELGFIDTSQIGSSVGGEG